MFNTLIFLAFLCREQPPSGGCVLKQLIKGGFGSSDGQPPSGGCVLKLTYPDMTALWFEQPPSGGCVLKLHRLLNPLFPAEAAAFGRLCVET